MDTKVVVAVLFAFVCAASSCANNGSSPSDGGVDVAIGPCGPGSAVMCSGQCVNTQGDFKNCGACGKQCADGQVCSSGMCAAVCGGGTTHCANDCIDLGKDVNNCGMCGKACPSGNVCSTGTCALTCQAGLTNCSGDCADLTQDDDNCGMCGNACGGGQVCVGSQCVATCQSGWVSCPDGDSGTTCVDLKTDPQNCNGCGNACPAGYFCVNGACGVSCAGGTTKCGTGLSAICVDETIDPNHCGSCVIACGTGNVCASAHCCPTSTPYYCGACNTYSNCVLATGGYIVAGYDTTCAINKAGAVFCWGDNGSGQAGTNDSMTFSYDTAQQVVGLTNGNASLGAGYDFSLAVTNGGGITGWGDDFSDQLGNATQNDYYAPIPGPLSSGVTRITGTEDVTCIQKSSGAVDCFGYDGNDELGNGGTVTFGYFANPVATKITNAVDVAGAEGLYGNMICAVLTTGAVKCWGTSFEFGSGSLGDGTSTASTTPVTVSGIATAKSVAVSYTHACIVLTTGALECWGDNTNGGLGTGTKSTTVSTKPVATTLTSGVARVAVGEYFTCVLTTTGAVECVGSNSNGQIGDGTTADRTAWKTPIASGAIDLTAGDLYACALLSNGSAKCWGYNFNGQLGNGTMTDSSTPVLVKGF